MSFKNVHAEITVDKTKNITRVALKKVLMHNILYYDHPTYLGIHN